MNGPALESCARRAFDAVHRARVLGFAALQLAVPRVADRFIPPGYWRSAAMHAAMLRLPGMDSDAARAWLGAQIGVDFDIHPARALGVTVGRIFPAGEDGARPCFDWAPSPNDAAERTGRRAILVPVLGDVVAIDAVGFKKYWSLSGDLDPLGWDEPALDDVLAGPAPVVGICEDALSWLAHLTMDRAGGIRAVLRHGPGDGDLAPAIAVLDWRAPFVDRLLRREDVTLIAESDGHAEQLEHAIDAWRKRQVPRHRPEILVADAPAEAVLAAAGPA